MADLKFINSDLSDVKRLREMDLHEIIIVNSQIEIMKVLGGWLYTITKEHKDNVYITTAFIPELRI